MENEKVTVENGRLRVTLDKFEFEKIGRYGVFNDAMRMLGNKSEAAILEQEPIIDDKIMTQAIEIAFADYLHDHCHYNVSETLMRYDGGHRMSEGMQADVSAARSYANTHWRDYSTNAKTGLKTMRDYELKYRRAVEGLCGGWKIEIIGAMPEWIGMCRYTSTVEMRV